MHVLARAGSEADRLADLAGRCTIVVADLREPDAVAAAVREVRPSVVFHLAAAAMHAGKSPGTDELVTTNLRGTVALMDVCRDLALDAFVNVGDAFEYGPGTGAFAEDRPCQPTSFDGITKLAATIYGRALAETGMPVVNVRPFSIVGRGDDPRRLVPRLVETARVGSPLALSDRRIPRDFVAVADVVELLGIAADPRGAGAGPGVQLRERHHHDARGSGRGGRAGQRAGDRRRVGRVPCGRSRPRAPGRRRHHRRG